MKKFYYILSVFAIPVLLIIQGYSSGSPGGKTGSPGDSFSTCTQCHGGTATSVSGWIAADIPGNEWIPGQTYTITATGMHTGVVRFGFEITAENAAGEKVGTFTLTEPTRTRFTSGNTSVTHTLAGTTPTGNNNAWTVNWTAPTTDEGEISFFAAFNAANGNGNTTGDVIYKTSLSVEQSTIGVEDDALATSISVYPNPAVNYFRINLPVAYSGSEIRIVSINGKTMSTFIDNGINEIYVDGYPDGLYLVIINSPEGVISRKIFVQ